MSAEVLFCSKSENIDKMTVKLPSQNNTTEQSYLGATSIVKIGEVRLSEEIGGEGV